MFTTTVSWSSMALRAMGNWRERVGHGVGPPVAEVVVVGQHRDGARRGVELRDDAAVCVEQAGHLLGDLAQELGEVELAGDGDGGLDERLQLALARQAGGQVVAPADEMRELVDVLLLDAPVTAGGARARQEPGRGPATDGVRRHARDGARQVGRSGTCSKPIRKVSQRQQVQVRSRRPAKFAETSWTGKSRRKGPQSERSTRLLSLSVCGTPPPPGQQTSTPSWRT